MDRQAGVVSCTTWPTTASLSKLYSPGKTREEKEEATTNSQREPRSVRERPKKHEHEATRELKGLQNEAPEVQVAPWRPPGAHPVLTRIL